jgi:hypothetical protein
MRLKSVMRTFPIVLLAASMTAPSFAATPAMQACSAKWADLKAAGKTKGQTWPEFWSQCSKDFAAKNGEPTQPEKTTSKKAPEKSAKTAAVDESDSSGSGEQKKACDEKWGSYKAKSGAHGWHDYFQFMAKRMSPSCRYYNPA